MLNCYLVTLSCYYHPKDGFKDFEFSVGFQFTFYNTVNVNHVRQNELYTFDT